MGGGANFDVLKLLFSFFTVLVLTVENAQTMQTLNLHNFSSNYDRDFKRKLRESAESQLSGGPMLCFQMDTLLIAHRAIELKYGPRILRSTLS